MYLPRQMEDGLILDGLSEFDRFLLDMAGGWIEIACGICEIRRFARAGPHAMSTRSQVWARVCDEMVMKWDEFGSDLVG